MSSALFWDITQRVVVIPYRRFATRYGPIFKGQGMQEEKVWEKVPKRR